MNLTTPPDVVDLSADRTEQLRTGLVAYAGRDSHPSHRPVWRPALAAVAGVTAVIAGTIAGTERRDDTTLPAGQATGTASASTGTPESVQPTAPAQTAWTAPPSRVVNMDLGPASAADTQKVIERCLIEDTLLGITTEDAKNAKVLWSRRIIEPWWYDHDTSTYHFEARPQIAAYVTTAGGRKGAWCRDRLESEIPIGLTALNNYPSPPRTALERTKGFAIRGGTSGGAAKSESPWVISKDYSFAAALEGIARVEMRIAWPGGAGAWYASDVRHGTGYVAAVAHGPHGKPPADARVELRAFDSAGKQIYRTTASPDGPFN